MDEIPCAIDFTYIPIKEGHIVSLNTGVTAVYLRLCLKRNPVYKKHQSSGNFCTQEANLPQKRW